MNESDLALIRCNIIINSAEYLRGIVHWLFWISKKCFLIFWHTGMAIFSYWYTETRFFDFLKIKAYKIQMKIMTEYL